MTQIMFSVLPCLNSSSEYAPKYAACKLPGVTLTDSSPVSEMSSMPAVNPLYSEESDGDGASRGVGRRKTHAMKCLKLQLGPIKRLPSLQAIKEPRANSSKAKRIKASMGSVTDGGEFFFVVGSSIIGAYVKSWLGIEPFG